MPGMETGALMERTSISAARIMDLLEELGVVGEAVAGGRSRRVLLQPGKDPFKELLDKRKKQK